MLWWRYNTEEETARKTERGQEENETGRESRAATGGFSRSFEGEVTLRLGCGYQPSAGELLDYFQ